MPRIINKYRIAACTQEKLKPFFNQLEEKMLERNYIPSLIFNYDETSLLRKRQPRSKVVLPASCTITPEIEEKPVITKCTACLCITADCSPFPSALILPSTLPEDILKEYTSPYLDIYQTATGFINSSIFKKHLLKCILPEITRRQERYSPSSHLLPAQLFLDGHSSRLQIQVWSAFQKHNIDVCILPSHTSHILQPLDCGVNSQLKLELSDIPPLPQKRKLDMFLLGWIRKINDAISMSLSPMSIRHGFRITGLCPLVPDVVLVDLPLSRPDIEKKRQQKVEISGAIITEKKFLTDWAQTEKATLEDDELEEEEFEKENSDESSSEFSEESENEEIQNDYALRQIPDMVDLRVTFVEKETEKEVPTLEQQYLRFQEKADGIEELIHGAEQAVAEEATEKRKGERKVMKKKLKDSFKGRSVLEVDNFFNPYLSELRKKGVFPTEAEQENEEFFLSSLRTKRMKVLPSQEEIRDADGELCPKTPLSKRRKLSSVIGDEVWVEPESEPMWKSSPYRLVLEEMQAEEESEGGTSEKKKGREKGRSGEKRKE
jgi:hypothetical protein